MIPNSKRGLDEVGFNEKIDPVQLSINFLQSLNYRTGVTHNNEGLFVSSHSSTHRGFTNFSIPLMLIGKQSFVLMPSDADIEKKNKILQDFFTRGLLRKINMSSLENQFDRYDLHFNDLNSDDLLAFLNETSVVERINHIFKAIKHKIDLIDAELKEDIDAKISFLD